MGTAAGRVRGHGVVLNGETREAAVREEEWLEMLVWI